jgi:asparagine synthase (glutamine-hydrolysing)
MIKRRPVVSLTYGARNCRDVYYASRIANFVGSDHHWFDLPNGKWVEQYVDLHLDLTEGFHSWIHSNGMSTLAPARELMDVNLTGWDGGTVFAYPEGPDFFHFNAVNDQALLVDLFSKFNQKFTWPSITEAEESLLYSQPVWRKVQGLAFESFRTELSKYLDYRAEVRGQYFFLRNHCARLTQYFTVFTRSHVEVRFPFFDYDLFDFIFSLPIKMITYRKLYRAVIQRETPQLAYIPYEKDEFLPTTHKVVWGVHAAGVKMKRRINRHLWKVFPTHGTLYADYENYLRNELREWAEDILFDRRTTEHGIFEPSFLHSLMQCHLANREPWTIGKIAPLITYEMMLRRYVD